MKGSSATSAKATASPPPTGQSSDRPRSRTSVSGFALAGPSDLPDPSRYAYRRDLADVALAGRVIASHYAEPVERTLASASMLRAGPSDAAEALVELLTGEPFRLLDDSLGWAWGYADSAGLVGYVRSESLIS